MSFYFEPINNNTGAMTINIDARGAVPIVTAAGNALANADLRAGRLYTLVYNGTAMVVSGSNVGEDAESGIPALLVDAKLDNDAPFSSNDPYDEELAESFSFTTYEDNVWIEYSITIPVVVYTTSGDGMARNGACRVYLDGDGFNVFPGGAVQWNGTLIANAGQWCTTQNVPNDTTLSCKAQILVPSAGVHTIRTHIAGSTTDTVIELHGRRFYQVKPVKAVKGDPGEGTAGTSNLSVVRTIATSNVDISTALENGDTLNGVPLQTNHVVLLAAQTAPSENGIYVVPASGAASRHPDFLTYDSHCGRYFSVQSGAEKADTLWRCTSDPGGTLGTTALVFSEFSGASAGREMLTGNRTYYVRTDGSDSNTGLANTSGGAFLTIQKAIDVIAATLDLGPYNVTISVGAGTFTGANTLKRYQGVGPVTIQGAGNTTIVSVTSNSCFSGKGVPLYQLKSMKLQTTTGGNAILATIGSQIEYEGIEFGACVDNHVFAASNSVVTQTGNCTVTGGAACHLWADSGARINVATRTIALSGTPAFSTAFAQTTLGASLSAILASITGSATGSRFNSASGGVITTNGGGASFFPGSVAGTGTNFGASPWGLYS
jgi:hypothetical protein